jgi:hypothetical protein
VRDVPHSVQRGHIMRDIVFSRAMLASPIVVAHSCFADRRDTSAEASPTGHEQRLHVSASRHLRVRWLKPLAQLAFGNERTREKEAFFQIASLA